MPASRKWKKEEGKKKMDSVPPPRYPLCAQHTESHFCQREINLFFFLLSFFSHSLPLSLSFSHVYQYSGTRKKKKQDLSFPQNGSPSKRHVHMVLGTSFHSTKSHCSLVVVKANGNLTTVVLEGRGRGRGRKRGRGGGGGGDGSPITKKEKVVGEKSNGPFPPFPPSHSHALFTSCCFFFLPSFN